MTPPDAASLIRATVTALARRKLDILDDHKEVPWIDWRRHKTKLKTAGQSIASHIDKLLESRIDRVSALTGTVLGLLGWLRLGHSIRESLIEWPACDSYTPRYASITAGLLRNSAAVPFSVTRPASNT